MSVVFGKCSGLRFLALWNRLYTYDAFTELNVNGFIPDHKYFGLGSCFVATGNLRFVIELPSKQQTIHIHMYTDMRLCENISIRHLRQHEVLGSSIWGFAVRVAALELGSCYLLCSMGCSLGKMCAHTTCAHLYA